MFRLDEHLDRLRNSLKIIGLDSDTISNQVADAIPEFLRRNQALIEPGDDWSIIAFATPGAAGSGRPTVCVHGYPLPFKSWASQYETGVPVIVSQIRQMPPNCLPPELKCRSRMHFYLADREAAARQPGARAILLDQDGYIAEATTANVVVFRKGEGFVSPPHDNILVGVSLGVVEELAAKINVPFVTAPPDRRRTLLRRRSAAHQHLDLRAPHHRMQRPPHRGRQTRPNLSPATCPPGTISSDSTSPTRHATTPVGPERSSDPLPKPEGFSAIRRRLRSLRRRHQWTRIFRHPTELKYVPPCPVVALRCLGRPSS